VTNFAPKDDIVSTCPKEEEEEEQEKLLRLKNIKKGILEAKWRAVYYSLCYNV
jgi:hypothetical protein